MCSVEEDDTIVSIEPVPKRRAGTTLWDSLTTWVEHVAVAVRFGSCCADIVQCELIHEMGGGLPWEQMDSAARSSFCDC